MLLFAVMLCARIAPAHATPADKTTLALCVLRDAPGLTATTLFAAPDRFDCTTPQSAYGSGDYWLMSQPLAIDASDARFVVRTLSVWQRAMTMHVRFADGTTFSRRIDAVGASRRIQLGGFVQQRLPHRRAPIIRVLWHVEGSVNLRGILLGTSIMQGGEAGDSNARMAAIYAGFAGLALALLLYNLALWRALRYGFLGYYCLMTLGLIGYAFTSSGTFGLVFPDIANTFRLRLNYLTLAVVGVATLQFMRYFFEARVFGVWLRVTTRIVSAAVLGSAMLVMVFAPQGMRVFDAMYSVSFAALLATTIPVLWSAWRRHSDYLGLFALAWGIPISAACLRTLYSLGFVSYNFWIDNSTLISMALEAVLSSVAIAYRVQLLSRERDAARQQEVAARMLADMDPLTGLLNRRAFLSRAIGRDGEQILLVADIDHFKRVNDTLGHDGGDEVLRVFARTLRQSVPPDALVARFGGEEFAIVMPASRGVSGDDILARLRTARMPFDLTVTASIGTCRGPLITESDWKTLYRRADRALFEAKHAGRDRVRVTGAFPHAA